MRMIDADKLKETIKNYYQHCALDDEVYFIINNAPTVEQKYYERVIAQINPVIEARPQGQWITVKQDTVLGTFEVKNKVCNKCNHATKYEYPFCPWCGADMQKGE